MLGLQLAPAQDPLADPATVAPWAAQLTQPRQVVDQAVICFDGASFLREVARWDGKRFWPVLLWDSDLVPKFLEAFRPRQILLARYEAGPVELDAALRVVGESWGLEVAGSRPADFLAALRDGGRVPLGIVLLAEGSPELLGGVAVAAGRLHLPVVLATEKHHGTQVTAEEMEGFRQHLIELLAALDGVDFRGRFDDLDLVTVANDMPFAWKPSDPAMHGGAYTIDDAIARNDDRTRWGWVGRLIGGPARSVYMAMGALFLQPERGLFFSRYDPDNAAFGAHDPGAALATFQDRFPTEMIRHPEATLTRWRSVQWPAGNRFGFVFVNSSGGARSWSTSKGGATHFDVPDTVPCVVHYTHSGSAGRPFDVDSIAGRWLTNGAYVYFGSHAEPYLQAFVPPSVLAGRVACGVPLGVAMRHLFDTRLVGQRETKTADGEKKLVSFNLSGPWKLAYFGDPGYRLEPVVAPRLDPEPPRRGQLDSFARFAALKPPDKTQRPAHLVTGTALARIDPKGRQLYDDVAWRRTYRKAPESYREEIQREAVRAWVASLRADRVALYDPDRLRKLAPVPKAIRTTLADGATSPEAARLVTELAREVLAGLATYPDSEVAREPALARWVLEVACCFPHPEGYRKQLFEWVRATCAQLGVPPAELQAAVLERDWVPEEARRVVTAEVH